MPNAYLVRDIVPIIIEGVQSAPGGQGQGCQVVAGPAGIEQDHGTTHRGRLTHTGPLVDNRELLGKKGSSFFSTVKTTAQRPQRTPRHQGLWPYLGLQVDAGRGGPPGNKAEAGGKRKCADNKEGVAHQDSHQQKGPGLCTAPAGQHSTQHIHQQKEQ